MARNQSKAPPQARVALRSGERGAAVFVVMMAILVITSMGTWAIYSAGLTSTGTGYQRAAAQTLYTAELGVLAGTGVLSVAGMANGQIMQAEADFADNTPDDCLSVPTGKFCKRIDMDDLNVTVETETADMPAGSTFDILQVGTDTSQGSMGPHYPTQAGALQGHFSVELTEMKEASLPGMDLKGDNDGKLPQYKHVTLTSYGVVRPHNDNLCSANETASAGQVAMRAHVVIGPIQSQSKPGAP